MRYFLPKWKFLICFWLFCSSCLPAQAREWKDLHELADRINLSHAQEDSQQDPQALDKLYTLGLVYLNLYKEQQALDVFERMLKVEPLSYMARWGKAEVLRRRHEFSQSQDILADIIKQQPKYYPAYISLAYIRYMQMDFTECTRLMLVIMRQDPKAVDANNYSRAHLIYAGAKGMIAHYGGPVSKIINGIVVMPALKDAQKIMPDTGGLFYGLGSYYLLVPNAFGRDIGLAKQYLEKAIEKEPLFPDSYVRLAQIHHLQGDQAKYQYYLNKALEIDPKSELAWDIKNRTCNFICVDKNAD